MPKIVPPPTVEEDAQPHEKRVILVDAYNRRVETRPGFWHTLTHYKGEEVELPPEEIERGERIGALGTVEDLEAATPEPTDTVEAMDEEQVLAYLNQHNDEAGHVLAIERNRIDPRPAVIDAASKIQAVQAERAIAQSDAAAGPTGE